MGALTVLQDRELDHIQVAAPCSEDWAGMRGDEKSRHCSACAQTVYNFDEMSTDEISELILRMESERVCVRFYRRADGTVLTKDCPVGLAERARRLARRAIVAAGLGGLATVLGFGALTTTGVPAPPPRKRPQSGTKPAVEPKAPPIPPGRVQGGIPPPKPKPRPKPGRFMGPPPKRRRR